MRRGWGIRHGTFGGVRLVHSLGAHRAIAWGRGRQRTQRSVGRRPRFGTEDGFLTGYRRRLHLADSQRHQRCSDRAKCRSGPQRNLSLFRRTSHQGRIVRRSEKPIKTRLPGLAHATLKQRERDAGQNSDRDISDRQDHDNRHHSRIDAATKPCRNQASANRQGACDRCNDLPGKRYRSHSRILGCGPDLGRRSAWRYRAPSHGIRG
jgi:hypothetical protein